MGLITEREMTTCGGCPFLVSWPFCQQCNAPQLQVHDCQPASRRWLWVGCQCSCAFRTLCEFADLFIEDLRSSSTSYAPGTAASVSATTTTQPSLEDNHWTLRWRLWFSALPRAFYHYPGFSLINPRPKRIAPSAALHLQCFQRFSIPWDT
jgi:hypothetical protein